MKLRWVVEAIGIIVLLIVASMVPWGLTCRWEAGMNGEICTTGEAKKAFAMNLISLLAICFLILELLISYGPGLKVWLSSLALMAWRRLKESGIV